VRRALDAIRDTFRAFAREALRAGADGLFYATVDWATRDLVTPDEYYLYARSDDLAILDAASGAAFNILHVCRRNNLLAELAGYPAHAVSWAADGEGNPTLERGLGLIRGAAVGGIAQETALQADGPQEILAQVLEGWRQTGGRRWIVGPGCSIPPGTPESNLVAVREAVLALAEEE
jgi:uroporphyrinogen decarboxylase